LLRLLPIPVSIILVMLPLVSCRSSNPISEPQPIGVVTATSGFPAISRNSMNYIIGVQSKIYQGDIVDTDEYSRVHISLNDGTVLQLGGNSHLVLNRFSYTHGFFYRHIYKYMIGNSSNSQDPAPKANLTLTSGSLKTTASAAMQSWRASLLVRTPIAQVDIRGQDSWVGLDATDSSLQVTMLHGRWVAVENSHGETRLNQSGMGVTVGASTAPQVARQWSDRQLTAALQGTAINPESAP
jgi:hypothetical protein